MFLETKLYCCLFYEGKLSAIACFTISVQTDSCTYSGARDLGCACDGVGDAVLYPCLGLPLTLPARTEAEDPGVHPPPPPPPPRDATQQWTLLFFALLSCLQRKRHNTRTITESLPANAPVAYDQTLQSCPPNPFFLRFTPSQ